MECAERGLLDGVAPSAEHPRFGDGATLLRTLEAIGTRSSALGTLLAEGSRRAAASIGRGSERFALHVKGMELPGYDPRALQTLALGYAVGTRGADHNKSSAYEADLSPGTERTTADLGKGLLAARSEDKAALLDSLVLCKFLRGVFEDFHAEAAAMLAAVTGWDVTPDELRTTAERIVTAKKLFNVAAGWTRAEDTLPSKILEESIAGADGAPVRLTKADLDAMIGAYYEARGWTTDGAVPETALRRLDLDRAALVGR
jgi:aldehyde:ferredoxin oxidoreductase